jgi:hypothetical protein
VAWLASSGHCSTSAVAQSAQRATSAQKSVRNAPASTFWAARVLERPLAGQVGARGQLVLLVLLCRPGAGGGERGQGVRLGRVVAEPDLEQLLELQYGSRTRGAQPLRQGGPARRSDGVDGPGAPSHPLVAGDGQARRDQLSWVPRTVCCAREARSGPSCGPSAGSTHTCHALRSTIESTPGPGGVTFGSAAWLVTATRDEGSAR